MIYFFLDKNSPATALTTGIAAENANAARIYSVQRGTVEKIPQSAGIYIAATIAAAETITARISFGLEK